MNSFKPHRSRIYPSLWIAAIALGWLAGGARAGSISFSELDAYITNAMPQWGMPGMALAIVTNDTTAYLRGYGVRTYGGTDPVDENTIFAIGSVSKTFNSTALGLLVQDGKLDWDERIISYLPHFRLYADLPTHDMRLRDLLSMRTGVGSECEFLAYNADWDRAEIIRRLRYVPADPEVGFRAGMLYRNPLVVTSGQLVPVVTNQTWDEFVAARLFEPLGMTRTLTSIRDLARFDNVATPHILNSNGVPVAVPYRNMDMTVQSGGVLSSARDMAQWMRLHLNDGVFNSNRLLAADVLAEIRTPHTSLGSYTNAIPPAEQLAYALGWVTYRYQGYFVLVHGGEIDGMCAYLLLVPELKLGVSTLTNAERYRGQEMQLGRAVAFLMLDRTIGLTNTDWNPPLLAEVQSLEAGQEATWQAIVAARHTGTSPSLPLAGYASNYVSAVFGGVRTFVENGQLVYQHSASNFFDLEHWEYDTFLGTCREPANDLRLFPPTFVTFTVSNNAVIQMSDLRYTYVPASGAGPAGVPVSGDYDGDGAGDYALYEECTGNWYARLSSVGDTWVKTCFGGSGFSAVPGDYDGDGRFDLGVYMETTAASSPLNAPLAGQAGTWQARLSASGYALATISFGGCGYRPAPGDYDGDGRMDLGLYSAAAGAWLVRLSSYGYALTTASFGGAAYEAAPSDIDGDRRTDPLIQDPATGWHYALLSSQAYVAVAWQE